MSMLLQPEQAEVLRTIAREAPDEALRRRARVLLLYDEGRPTREVAAAVGLSESQTRYWRRAFLKQGMALFAGADARPARRAATARQQKPLRRTTTGRPASATKKEAGSGTEEGTVERLVEVVEETVTETIPALLPKSVRKKAEKIAAEVRDVLGKKVARKIEDLRTDESLQAFVAFLEKQRRKIEKKIDTRDLKKKQLKFLRKQLKVLEAQLARAEKLLQKLEG